MFALMTQPPSPDLESRLNAMESELASLRVENRSLRSARTETDRLARQINNNPAIQTSLGLGLAIPVMFSYGMIVSFIATIVFGTILVLNRTDAFYDPLFSLTSLSALAFIITVIPGLLYLPAVINRRRR